MSKFPSCPQCLLQKQERVCNRIPNSMHVRTPIRTVNPRLGPISPSFFVVIAEVYSTIDAVQRRHFTSAPDSEADDLYKCKVRFVIHKHFTF